MDDCFAYNKKSIIRLEDLSFDKYKLFTELLINNQLTCTEKIDGSACRISVIDNNIYYQNSFDQLISEYQIDLPIYFKLFNQLNRDKLLSLYKSYGNFKLIGDLIYTNDMIDNNNTVTPVCTTYNINQHGSIGTIVIYDTLTNDCQSYNQELVQQFKSTVDSSQWKIYSKQDIILNYNFNCSNIYNDQLKSLYKSSKSILFKKIKGNLPIPYFKTADNIFEGYVFSNDQLTVAVINDNYKLKKQAIYTYSIVFDECWDQMFELMFNIKRCNFRKHLSQDDIDISIYEQSFLIHKDRYILLFEQLLNILQKDKNIPKLTKHIQLDMKYNKYYKLLNAVNVNQFIDNFLSRNKQYE